MEPLQPDEFKISELKNLPLEVVQKTTMLILTYRLPNPRLKNYSSPISIMHSRAIGIPLEDNDRLLVHAHMLVQEVLDILDRDYTSGLSLPLSVRDARFTLSYDDGSVYLRPEED